MSYPLNERREIWWADLELNQDPYTKDALLDPPKSNRNFKNYEFSALPLC